MTSLALLLALMVPGTAGRSAEVPIIPDYLETVVAFAAGDAGMLDRAATWPPAAVTAVTRGFRQPPEKLIAAVVLLHVSVARRTSGDVARAHRAAAFGAATRLEGIDRSSMDSNRARLSYLTVLSALQGALDVTGIELLIASGLRLMPDDPELLLTRGSLQEMQIAIPPSGSGVLRPRREDEQQLAARASQDYERALAGAPGLVEARVRLGRARYRQRRLAEAHTELERARTEATELPLQYFAALFLGVVHEDAGRLDEAERCYVSAQGLFERAQAPRLALAHLQHRRGRARQAADILAAGEAVAPETVTDPWWVYDYGQFWRIDDRLKALRQAVIE